MENLINYLHTIYPLSDSLREHLLEILQIKEFTKNDFLLRAGNTCRHIFFIESGLVRCYYTKEGEDISCWFMKEGDVVVSVESFFGQRPSYESIQAMEDTTAYSIGWQQLQSIYRRFPEFNFTGRVLTEKYYTLSERRLYSMRQQRATDRYECLLNDAPELINRIPVKYLASYLGISRETLSRIRHSRMH
jgi:CRP/FNR family transcriptional regulator, anaerobic regulatory protein